MRPRRAFAALPLIALAPISLMAACSDDKNDAVGSTQASSESPIGSADTGSSSPGTGSSTVDSGADATEGPTLTEVIRATLANGSARYLMAADPDATVDDLVAGLLSGTGSSNGGSGSDTTATGGSDTTSVESTSSGSDAAATGGCDLEAGDRAAGAADIDQRLHCVVLPDGSQVVIDGRDIYLGADGAWSVTTVQFDSALAQLDADQLMALHDPTAVLASIASEVHGTSGPNGLEYQVTLQVTDLDDPFVMALAQRAGATSVVVHVFADETGQSVQALAYEFPQAGSMTGGANGDGTGGATATSGTVDGSPQNPAGGGNGSTTAVGSSLPDSGSTSVPSSTFEDIPTVAVAFTSFSDAVDIQVPSEPETLNLGDLGASLEIDLSPGLG